MHNIPWKYTLRGSVPVRTCTMCRSSQCLVIFETPLFISRDSFWYSLELRIVKARRMYLNRRYSTFLEFVGYPYIPWVFIPWSSCEFRNEMVYELNNYSSGLSKYIRHQHFPWLVYIDNQVRNSTNQIELFIPNETDGYSMAIPGALSQYIYIFLSSFIKMSAFNNIKQ